MPSPYFSGNVGQGWGPPGGLAGLIAQGRETPGNPAGPALAQFFLNMASKGEAETTQLKADAKVADARFEQQMAGVFTKAGEDPKVMGLTKDMWKGAGDDRKVAMMKAFDQQQQSQQVEQGFKAGVQMYEQRQQEMAQRGREMQADSAFANVARNAGERVPAVATPGMFGQPVAPAGNFGPVTPQSLVSAMRDQPESFNARGASPFLRQLAEQQGKGEIMPVARTVGGRNLIVNPKSGAFNDVTQPAAPQIPAGLEPLGATEDEDGRLTIRYGFPKAEGKALTQTEVSGIAALNQAESDLNTLENIYKELGPDYGGPVSGRVKSAVMAGQNANIASLENAITAATPNLARGVFREVGVLTDQDVARYKQLLPSPNDTQEVRNRKIKQLRDRIAQGRKETVASLKAAGRDVEGFEAKEGAPAATRFDSEAAARSGGAKTGDVIELYDPATATYRKARLK